MLVAWPGGVRMALQGEHGDRVVGYDVGGESDSVVWETVALNFLDEGSMLVRRIVQPVREAGC